MTIWQPILVGKLLRLRPLMEEDFEPLFLIASDPLIWEQHPEPDRYQREKFLKYFRSGMESKGGLVIIDQKTQQMIGCSRYTRYEEENSSIEVGYTFLVRDCWGSGHNRELKSLMLTHAFQFVSTVLFYVGDTNYRSQKAVQKIGGKELKRISTIESDGSRKKSVVYAIQKKDFAL